MKPRVLVEQCRRISIRDLIVKAELIRPGEHTRFRLPDLPYIFHGYLSEDWETGFIEIEGGHGCHWPIRRKATHLLHCWDDSHFFILGYSDGKPARALLLTTTRAGTRSDLSAHYRSSHINSTKRRLQKRQRIFADLLIVDDPANMTRCYVPECAGGDGGLVVEQKPRGMWWQTWWRRFRHSQPEIVLVPVRRPCGINTNRFHRYLDQINAHHIRAGKIARLSPPSPSRRSPAPPRSRRQAGAGDVDGSGAIGWMESVFKRS